MANRGWDDYVSATAAAHRLGVSTRTLRRHTPGRSVARCPQCRWAADLPDGDLDAITRKPRASKAVGYARVSSRRQQAEGDLDRQVARQGEHDTELIVFSDVASGLPDRRAGLRKALGECMKPGVDRLVVEHPDRLARFGVGVIEPVLAGYGCRCPHLPAGRRVGRIGAGARHAGHRDQLRRTFVWAAVSEDETVAGGGVG